MNPSTNPIITETLANKFLSLLETEIGTDRYALVCERNAAEPRDDSHVCHSHDFCDANMVMAEAFEGCGLATPDMDSDEDSALWGAAWDRAFQRMVELGTVPAPACPAGWEVISTGGNCEAWYRLLRGYADAYAMITASDGATVPHDADGDVLLGLYAENGGEQLVSFQLPLTQALGLAERVVGVQQLPRGSYASLAYLTDADERKADKAEARARNGR